MATISISTQVRVPGTPWTLLAGIGHSSGKVDDANKIGKYGLGFNCAYHFTDVVSFVTRDQYVAFDPQATNLPDGMLGLRSNFVEDRLLDTYPAQFGARPVPLEFAGWH